MVAVFPPPPFFRENNNKKAKKKMSLMPITPSFFPRNMFDMDLWSKPTNVGPSTLDLFDPFDELDRMMGKNMLWLNHPEMLTDMIPMAPKVPQKYRITLNVAGYSEKSIKTEIVNNQLIVSGCECTPGCEGSIEKKTGDYSLKEFKRTYDLPLNLETTKLVSFITKDGKLVIEIPFKEQTDKRLLFPRIVEKDGARNVEFDIHIPDNVDPSKVSVVCKDRDVIVRADYKIQKPDGYCEIHWLNRSTFPENTDFETLKCLADKHELKICAPLGPMHLIHKRHVPIEFKKDTAAIENKKI